MDNWKPYSFGIAIDCNPKVSIKKNEVIENCEMEDIEPNFKYLYPRNGKLYKGSNSKFQNGDTVFARITPCLENGKIAQVKGLKGNKGIGSTEFFVFRGKDDFTDNDFVYHLCKSNLIRDTAVNSMTGASGRQRADIKALKRLILNFPPLSYQQKIASILSAYDDLIDVNIKSIELLEHSARELYKEWFVRLRFPGHKGAKFIKGVPKGWKLEKIDDVSEFINRGISPHYSPTGESTVLNQRCIRDNRINFENSRRQIKSVSSKKILRKGDVLINSTGEGTLGRTAQLHDDVLNVTADSHLTIARAKEGFSKEYYGLTIASLESYFELMALGSTGQTELGRKTIANILIKVPSKDVLEKFSGIIEPINNQINTLLGQNTHLRQIRDRLLPRLISGKLEVKEHKMEGKIIPITERPPKESERKANVYFTRRVLAAYIIDKLHKENTFGHVKLMKLMYLCEHLANIETASHYHRDAAGPYDGNMIRSIDSQLTDAKWFEPKDENNRYVYYPLSKKEEYKDEFIKHFDEKKHVIDSLINLFGKAKTEKIEMIATLFEAHRDLKSKSSHISDDAVIHEVLNNWHASKKRIDKKRWNDGLVWMRQRNWIE